MIRAVLSAVLFVCAAIGQCYPTHPVGSSSTVITPSPGCNEIGGSQIPFLSLAGPISASLGGNLRFALSNLPNYSGVASYNTYFLVDFIQPISGVQLIGTTSPACSLVVQGNVLFLNAPVPTLVGSCVYTNFGFIPPLPALQGFTFHAQAAMYDGLLNKWALTTPFSFTFQQ